MIKVKKEFECNLKKETKKRIEKMKREFSEIPKLKVFENKEGYNQIIAQVGIPLTALCEHHEVAFFCSASIAYIPGRWLIGLSKLARIAQEFLNPTIKTLQERATQQIINKLEEGLKPKGLMVIIKGRHSCISYRGVKKPSITITSAVKGIFATDSSAKSEFLQLVNHNDGEF